MKKIFTTLLLIVAFTSNAQFQENIDSGRPGNSFSVFTVGKNVFQIESGLDFYNEGNQFFSNSFFRYGITESIELNSGLLYNFTSGSEGVSSYYAGAKFHFFEGDNMLPSTAFQIGVGIPKDANDESFVNALFIMNFPFSERLSTTFNFGANMDFKSSMVNNISQLFYEGVYALNFSYALTNKWTTFVETYGTIDKFSNPKIKMNLNAGFSYLLNNNFLLDTLVSHGINTDNKLMVSVGFSYRLPL